MVTQPGALAPEVEEAVDYVFTGPEEQAFWFMMNADIWVVGRRNFSLTPCSAGRGSGCATAPNPTDPTAVLTQVDDTVPQLPLQPLHSRATW